MYAYPNSVLTETAIAAKLHAKRFTKEDGDLGTHAGRIKLLSWIVLYRPKHVWMAPECAPWCAWSRFNASRSLQSFDRIQQSQQAAQVHLKLCNLISKLQVSENRHAHLENPWTSALWSQRAVEEFLKASLPARLDQCMFGLKHPESHDPMEKKTRIQTTSREMWKELDQRTCLHEHAHAHISGQCTFRGHSMPVSKFAGFYPRGFAKAVIKGILRTQHGPMEQPVLHVETLEPPAKRARMSKEPSGENNPEPSPRKENFQMLQTALPKSGVKDFTNPMHEIFKPFKE